MPAAGALPTLAGGYWERAGPSSTRASSLMPYTPPAPPSSDRAEEEVVVVREADSDLRTWRHSLRMPSPFAAGAWLGLGLGWG